MKILHFNYSTQNRPPKKYDRMGIQLMVWLLTISILLRWAMGQPATFANYLIDRKCSPGMQQIQQ